MVPRARDRHWHCLRPADGSVRCSRSCRRPRPSPASSRSSSATRSRVGPELEPRPEIILFGRDPGTAEICDELGLRHVPDVATNAQGTPLLSDMFITGQALATNPVVCWANADIIFTPTIMRAAQVVTDHPRPAYLVGRRTDIDQLAPLDFSDGVVQDSSPPRALHGRRAQARELDRLLHVHAWAVRRASAVRDRSARLRPVADLGAADLGADVIDATDYVLAVHQRHDYSHVGTPGRRVQRGRGAAERGDRRRLAPLPLDRPRPAQAGRRRVGWFPPRGRLPIGSASGLRRALLALHPPAASAAARRACDPTPDHGRARDLTAGSDR